MVDVLIFGGGPAGIAAALKLGSGGATVRVAERSRYDTFRFGETLPPHAAPLLASIACSSILSEPDHIPSVGTVSVWGSEKPYENDFIFNPYGNGWHLDRCRFDRALAAEAEKAGVDVLRGVVPLTCRKVNEEWHASFRTAEGQTIYAKARWIFDATGRACWITRRQGARRIVLDRLVGLVDVVELSGEDTRTYIETLPAGWWYSALLSRNRAIAVFFTGSDLHDLTAPCLKKLWNDQLAQSRLTRERLGEVRADSSPRVVIAPTSILEQLAGPGWLAVGDSACIIDPLSSQGISQAISTGIEAAEAILAPDSDAAVKNYSDVLNERFHQYLDTRRAFYCAEQRWPQSPFWKRRHEDRQDLPERSARRRPW